MTAHKLLYKSFPRPDGTFIHIPRKNLHRIYDIIVIDEVSMLPKQMWDLLLSHGVYVIACGDPCQLPSISEENYILDHPHIFLDEIVRQAQESEIIRLSMDVREGRPIKPRKGTEVNIVHKQDLSQGMLAWADQIICGKNNTRRELNNCFRQMIWRDFNLSTPLVGDKVICLRNNWTKVTEAGEALVNGTSGKIDKMSTYPNRLLGTKCKITFTPDTYNDSIQQEQSFKDLIIDWKLINEGIPTITEKNFKTFPKYLRPEQFDYGYVITCWKAQGSEWDKVLFIAENMNLMSAEEYKRFLYTGITRSIKKLTLVLPN